MPNWSGSTLTTKGQALQAKVDAGETTLKLTKMKIGSGTIASGESLEDLTDLVSSQLDITISAISATDNIATATGVVTNASVTTGFYITKLGLFATDTDDTEILYSIITDSSPDYFPAASGDVTVSVEFAYNLVVSNASSVSATIDQTGLITVAVLKTHQEASPIDHPDSSVTDAKIGTREIDDTVTAASGSGVLTNLLSKLANMIKQITGKSAWYTAPDTTLATAATHIANTDNPHEVTAAQVGALSSSGGTVSGTLTMSGAINEAAVTMASAATMAIGAAAGNTISVTGTTTITAFDTAQAGTKRLLHLSSALTMTPSGNSFYLPGYVTSMTFSANDHIEFTSLGSNWQCTGYQPAAGNAPGGYGLGTTSTIFNYDTNLLLTNGFYQSASASLANLPDSTANYFVQVIGGNGVSYAKQIAANATTGVMYARSCVNGTWSAWKQLKTTDQCTFGSFKNFVMTVTSNTTATITADYCPYTQASISLTLDFGTTLSASTWYYVFVIYGSSGVTCLASTSSSAPTLPSGYTYYCRVGAVLTNSSTYLYRTIQRGRDVQYIVDGTLLDGVLPLMATGSAAQYTAVSTVDFVPTTASQIAVTVEASQTWVNISPNSNYTTPLVWYPQDNDYSNNSIFAKFILESSNIYWGTGSSVHLRCAGWEDNL